VWWREENFENCQKWQVVGREISRTLNIALKGYGHEMSNFKGLKYYVNFMLSVYTLMDFLIFLVHCCKKIKASFYFLL
jgi:hypothetical protein